MPPHDKWAIRGKLGCFRGTVATIPSLQILGGTRKIQTHPNRGSSFHLSRSLFYMSSELMPHRGQNSIGKVRIAAGTESFIKRDTQNRGRDSFIKCGLDCPASHPRIRKASGIAFEARLFQQLSRCEIQQPRGNHATSAPDLRDVGQTKLILIEFGLPQWCGLCISLKLCFASIGMLKDVQPLRVSRHNAVLDSVVDHLNEMASATGPAMQIALLSSAAGLIATRRAGCRSNRSA